MVEGFFFFIFFILEYLFEENENLPPTTVLSDYEKFFPFFFSMTPN